MHGDTAGSTGTLDLGAFSDEALIALLPRIEKELETRHASRVRDAFEQMRAIAETVGMTPEELLGRQASLAVRSRRGGRRKAASPAQTEPPVKPARRGRRPKVAQEEGAG